MYQDRNFAKEKVTDIFVSAVLVVQFTMVYKMNDLLKTTGVNNYCKFVLVCLVKPKLAQNVSNNVLIMFASNWQLGSLLLHNKY